MIILNSSMFGFLSLTLKKLLTYQTGLMIIINIVAEAMSVWNLNEKGLKMYKDNWSEEMINTKIWERY